MKEHTICLGNGGSVCPPECPIFSIANEISRGARDKAAQLFDVSVDEVNINPEKAEQITQAYFATHPGALEGVYSRCIRKIN